MKTPTWLNHGPIDADRMALIDDHMGNWVRFAPLLKTLSEDECMYVVKTEIAQSKALGRKPRPDFIHRPINLAMRKFRGDRVRELMNYINA